MNDERQSWLKVIRFAESFGEAEEIGGCADAAHGYEGRETAVSRLYRGQKSNVRLCSGCAATYVKLSEPLEWEGPTDDDD